MSAKLGAIKTDIKNKKRLGLKSIQVFHTEIIFRLLTYCSYCSALIANCNFEISDFSEVMTSCCSWIALTVTGIISI